MPFQSEKQRRWMWSNDPEMAEDWEDEKKWQKILKNKLISVPKQKTHIRKPKSGTDMDKCKDKLVQLNEKLKNMDLSHTFDTIKWEEEMRLDENDIRENQWRKILFPAEKVNARYTIEKDEFTDIYYDTFQVSSYTLLDNNRIPIHTIQIYHELYIEDIPEQIACKALEMLERTIEKDDYTDGESIGPYMINVRSSRNFPNEYRKSMGLVQEGTIEIKKLWISDGIHSNRGVQKSGPFSCDMGIKSIHHSKKENTHWFRMMHMKLVEQWRRKIQSKLEWWK